MAATTHVVKGRLIGPTTVELYEPLTVPAGHNEVEVLVPAQPQHQENPRLDALVKHFMSLSPGTRTKADIDRQMQEERDSWE